MTDDPLKACLAGRLPPHLAIAQALLRGESAASVRSRISELHCSGLAWEELHQLASGTTLEKLGRIVADLGVNHENAASPSGIAALFDRAVAISPEASVAFYSLGDPDRLHAATTEIVSWLRAERLMSANADVIDVGCGIGRVTSCLAPHVRYVCGTDISSGMLRLARARCSNHANVSFVLTGGYELPMFRAGSFDLMLAVDSFPYLMQSGVAEQYVCDASRLLRGRGYLVILNMSYRGSGDADRRDAMQWSLRFPLRLAMTDVAPFQLWDGRAFVFQRQ
jgi:SAM-dependent methyltransferase